MSEVHRPKLVSILWDVFKKKNQLTINSLPIVFVSFVILSICYGLVSLLYTYYGINQGFIIGTAYFWSCCFIILFSQIVEISLKDRMIRALLYYYIISFALNFGAFFLFPSLAEASTPQNKESGRKLTLLVIGIEVLTKQFMDLTSDFVNYFLAPYTKSWMEIFTEKLKWIIMHMAISLALLIMFFAMVLPVSVTDLDLSEWQKVMVFGVLFPCFRLLCGYMCKVVINSMDELGFFTNSEAKLKMIFMAKIGVALCFVATPLFSMLNTSSDPLLFSFQFIPHAFASKLNWIIQIPFIEVKIEVLRSKVYHLFRCSKQLVKPKGEIRLEKRESNVLKTLKRVSLEAIVLSSKYRSSLVDSSKQVEEKDDEDEAKKSTELENCNSIMINEAMTVLADKLGVLAYIMAFFKVSFFSDGSSSGYDINSFVNGVICVLGIVLTFDQISAILGFMMLEYGGLELDTELGLTDNPLNPIKIFGKGHKAKAIGNAVFISAICTTVFLAIAFAEKVKLFI